MGLETPWQRIAVFGIVAGFLLISAAIFVWLIGILDQGDRDSFWHWLDTHQDAIWGFLVASGPAILAWFFGRQTGLRRGARKASLAMMSVLQAAGNTDGADTVRSHAVNQRWITR